MISKKEIKRSFSRASFSYDEYSPVQKRANNILLDRIPKRFYEDVLEIGIGTGRLSRLLKNSFSIKHLTGVDLSFEMLKASKTHFSDLNGINLLCCDVERLAISPHKKFNLVVSANCLHWLKRPQDTVETLKEKHLKKGGVMALSFFGKNSLWELKKVLKTVLKDENLMLPTDFFPEQEKLLRPFKKNTYKLRHEAIIIKKEYNRLFDLLTTLKKTGVTPRVTFKRPILNSRQKIRYVDEKYRELFGKIIASYEIFFIIFEK